MVCNTCGEPVGRYDVNCRHCGNYIEPESEAAQLAAAPRTAVPKDAVVSTEAWSPDGTGALAFAKEVATNAGKIGGLAVGGSFMAAGALANGTKEEQWERRIERGVRKAIE